MTITNSNLKPKRRWLQFSLRGFLLLTAVIAVSLGWTMHKVREQRIAVEALQKMGCQVGYRIRYPNFDIRSPTMLEQLRKLLGEDAFRNVSSVVCGPQITDAGLAYLRRLDKLQYLDFTGTQITGAGLEHVQGLNILYLNLRKTQLTDTALVHVQGLKQLAVLDLSETHITDAGLVHLQGLTKLRQLDLRSIQVTDSGLVHLKELPNLSELYLGGKKITDAGLRRLKGMTQLLYLQLTGTLVTEKGCQDLKTTLPRLEISR